MHQAFAATLDHCLDEIREIQTEARTSRRQPVERRAWPMIVLRSPKGWTGPKRVDGQQIEGSWRSHQVPFSDARGDDDRSEEHTSELQSLMRNSYAVLCLKKKQHTK